MAVIPKNGPTDRAPRPIKCHVCGSKRVVLLQQKYVYGKQFSSWPWLWFCYNCRANVSCHPGSYVPMGHLADSATRKARADAHNAFDPIWRKSKWLTRRNAYKWLAIQMQLRLDDCHISRLDTTGCKRVIEICLSNKRPKRKDYKSTKSAGRPMKKERRLFAAQKGQYNNF